MGFFTKTIYKKDSKDKLRFLTVISRDGFLIQNSGLLDGKPIEHISQAKAKNIGKANETTPEIQAELEARALIVKKLKEGYFDTAELAKNTLVILPMLAKDFAKEKHKIDWNNAYIQPKLDGMRCLELPNKNKISRKNTPIENVDHIKVFTPENKEIITDGELYVHGLSFQENMKLIKKYRKGETEKVKYWIYDIVSDEPFRKRILTATLIVNYSENCKSVPTYKITSEKDMLRYHKEFIAEGFEGSIIRWGNTKYILNKRSSNLLKYKDFIDEVYRIVDVEPSDKNPEQGIIICESNPGGETFGCGMKFSHAERKEILINKDNYIGQTAEIRFFEYTDDGLPRFPVCVGFRLDK